MRKDIVLKYFDHLSEGTKSRIENGIEQNRKGNASFPAFADGKPVPDGTPVSVELDNHEFRFGANLFMLDEFETEEKNACYKQRFAGLFNLATVPFYWSDLEPEQGKPRYAKDSPRIYRRPAPDLCVEYCKANRIEPKCHCLNYDSFLPEWLKGADAETLKFYLSKRFSEIAERYGADIPSFEVTNETLQQPGSAFFIRPDFVEWSFREADKYFPNNRLIINDYNVFLPTVKTDRNMYYMQIERLLRSGVSHLDSIGFQYHSFCPPEGEKALTEERYNPDVIFDLMDLFGRLGLREQITEMTIPAYSNNEEDEEIQADLLENLYRIFFSHPCMEAVIYWNLVDGYTAHAPLGDMNEGENRFYGGMLRFDMSEKPAYKRLYHLIHKEWHTSVETTVKDGKVDFRGFYGDYSVTFHTPEGDRRVAYTLKSKKPGILG